MSGTLKTKTIMMVAEMKNQRSTSLDRQKFFEALYESTFPAVAEFISHRNGSFQDAKDTFQDALVIFYEKIFVTGEPVKVSEEAYLFGIAKHLWYRKFNQDHTNESLENAGVLNIQEEYFPSVESNKLVKLLTLTGEKCMELLRAFYYDQKPLENIRVMFGYRTAHSVTVQKFKCLEKIRDKVKANAIHYEDFTE